MDGEYIKLEDCVKVLIGFIRERLSLEVTEADCLEIKSELNKMLDTMQQEPEADEQNEYYKAIYNDRESMFSHTPYVLEERLINTVAAGDEAGAVAALKAINKAGDKAVLAQDSLRSAKNSIICTCTLLARASIQAGASPESAFALSDSIIRKVEEFTSKEQTLRYEESVLLQFLKLVRRNQTKGFPRAVRRAIHYIDAHLSEKLKLADIAKYAGTSSGYLSMVFSREMNMPLSEYILMRKIQESSYFIRRYERSMSDIAQLYGFSGQSYYISVFKRFMGVTPGEYRKNAY